MKKIWVLIFAILFVFSLLACSAQTVTLHCDTEGCENLVEVEVNDGEEVDEQWVVYCETCANETLNDK